MKKVEMYSTPTCHFCHLAKDFFEANKVEYTNYDVSTDDVRRSEVVERSGQMGVPVIFIDDKMVIGFDEGKIKEYLGL